MPGGSGPTSIDSGPPQERQMPADELDGVLAFLRAAERLKTVTRSGWTSTGEAESVAEHTWRLCLMAMVLYGRARGDRSRRGCSRCASSTTWVRRSAATCRRRPRSPCQAQGRPGARRPALARRAAPRRARREIIELWDEYEAASSPEARLAKGLDKLETILQHTQGRNPPTSTTPSTSTTASATPPRTRARRPSLAAR